MLILDRSIHLPVMLTEVRCGFMAICSSWHPLMSGSSWHQHDKSALCGFLADTSILTFTIGTMTIHDTDSCFLFPSAVSSIHALKRENQPLWETLSEGDLFFSRRTLGTHHVLPSACTPGSLGADRSNSVSSNVTGSSFGSRWVKIVLSGKAS